MVLTYGFWNTIGNFLAPMILTIMQATDPLDYKTPILTQWGFLGIMLPIFIWLPETPGKNHPEFLPVVIYREIDCVPQHTTRRGIKTTWEGRH